MLFRQYLFEQEFWGSVAAGILACCPKSGRILIAKRSSRVMEPGTYGIVGGKIDEKDTNIQAAALREFKEETKYSGTMQLIPAFVYSARGFEYHNFIGILQDEFNPQINWETESFHWFSLEDLKTLKQMHFGLKALLDHDFLKISQIMQQK